LFGVEYFWCDVVWGTADGSPERVLGLCGESEVSDFELQVFSEEEVVEFEIAVYDFEFV
jgi:hypothetical protein